MILIYLLANATPAPGGGAMRLHVLWRFPIPPAARALFADAGATSLLPGATAQDTNAVRAGAVVEEEADVDLPFAEGRDGAKESIRAAYLTRRQAVLATAQQQLGPFTAGLSFDDVNGWSA